MKAKKGISLIVLVITIIVIIILAAAVLLTLNNNNPIENSKTAVYDNDCAEVKSALALYVSNFMANDPTHNGPFAADETEVNIVATGTNKAAYASVAEDGTTTATTTTTTVLWSDLGFKSAPISIASAKYNPSTGEFTFTATQGYNVAE